MEQDKLPCDMDREVFERVWRRVMPEDRPDCPFVLEDTTSAPPEPARQQTGLTPIAPYPAAFGDNPLPWIQPNTVTESPASNMPAVQSVTPALREADLPADQNNVPCLGSSSAVYGSLLQQYIDHEISDWHIYQALAKRAQGGAGKVLSSMAADERRHAKRLSTAYFLISGVRYWPVERMATLPAGSFPAILRQRFADEQRGEASYTAAAEETTDPCLRELYMELAGDEGSHAWLLRGILEQM